MAEIRWGYAYWVHCIPQFVNGQDCKGQVGEGRPLHFITGLIPRKNYAQMPIALCLVVAVHTQLSSLSSLQLVSSCGYFAVTRNVMFPLLLN
jgi:hypothetical protein